MTTSLTTTIYAKIDMVVEYTDDEERAVQSMLSVDPITMENGTGSGQADVKVSDYRSIGVGSTASLNINVYASGALNNRSVTMASVKAFRCYQTGTNVFKLFNNATNPFNGPLSGGTPTWLLSEGGGLMMWNPVAGWPCTSGTHVLDIQNVSGGTSSYDLHFVGTSA